MSVDPKTQPPSHDSYDIIHRQFQQILSLILSHFKSSEPVVARTAERFYQTLKEVLKPTQYVVLFKRPEGLFLNHRPLPDSYVLNRLFETGRCSGICFQPGLKYDEVLAFVDEIAHCLQGGSSSISLGLQHDFLKHYYWIPANQTLPSLQTFEPELERLRLPH